MESAGRSVQDAAARFTYSGCAKERAGRLQDRGVFLRLRLFGNFFAALFALDALVDFFAMDGDILRRVDADPDLVSFDPQNRDGHIISDHDGLDDAPCENEHLPFPLRLYF